ncbi:MAG: heat-inducible transcriptional repressor HrcA, partial [Actinomycetes bacterium]
MAVLEDEGYIVQPHTSAGRIPTDKGYRTFVNRLNEVRALSTAESKAITQVLQGAVDLDDVMQKTVKLLAQLTGQVSVIQYPILSNSVVKHIDLIAVTDSRIMIVLVANSGRLEQATVELPKPLSLDSLDALRLKLKSTITDKKFSDVSTLISNFSKTANPVEVKSVEVIVEKVNNLAMESGDQKVMVGGAGNLARLDPDLSKNLLPVLDEIEENVVVLKLLGEMSSSDDIFVRIGHENKASNLHSASIVATGYSSGDSLSKLGIVGPTRMDYPGTMAAVGAVARYLGRILGNN